MIREGLVSGATARGKYAPNFGRLLHEPALPVETLREIVGLPASLPPAVAWYACAE